MLFKRLKLKITFCESFFLTSRLVGFIQTGSAVVDRPFLRIDGACCSFRPSRLNLGTINLHELARYSTAIINTPNN